MANAAFSFEGAVSDAKPFIPRTSFTSLKEGQILTGKIDSVVKYSGDDHIKADVLINGHITQITLWDYPTLEAAKQIIGETVKLVFRGMKGDYPKLYLKF